MNVGKRGSGRTAALPACSAGGHANHIAAHEGDFCVIVPATCATQVVVLSNVLACDATMGYDSTLGIKVGRGP